MNNVKHMVEQLRRIDHVDPRVQENINAAIVYLDLAIHLAAEHSVHLTGGTLPASEPFITPSTGSGIEYLKRQPTSK